MRQCLWYKYTTRKGKRNMVCCVWKGICPNIILSHSLGLGRWQRFLPVQSLIAKTALFSLLSRKEGLVRAQLLFHTHHQDQLSFRSREIKTARVSQRGEALPKFLSTQTNPLSKTALISILISMKMSMCQWARALSSTITSLLSYCLIDLV